MVVVKMAYGPGQLLGPTAWSGGRYMAERRRRREIEGRHGRRDRPKNRKQNMTPEQSAYRAARRRANQKLSFYTHAVAFGSTASAA
jgi:hypothetical protein